MATTLKIGSWNVANAVGDESSGVGRFGLRMKAQVELLKEQNFDIIMFQEIRMCKNEDGSKIMTPLDIAYYFASNLNMFIAGFEAVNPTDLSFWRLTLYNPKTVWSMGCSPVRTYDVSDANYTFDKDFGRIIMFNKFAPFDGKATINGSKNFWTCNVHFPLRLDEKLIYAELVSKSVDQTCGNNQVIIAGDCNVFMDNGGAEQLGKMKSNGFDEHTNHIEKTFVSFPWDKVQTKSHLDYVFTNSIVQTGKLHVQSVDVIDVSDTKISDHFPLIITINV